METTNMKPTKKQIEDWIKEHGAGHFDFKSRNLIIGDGGLGCIEKRDIMLPKIIGTKPLQNGNHQLIFSKKKYPDVRYEYLIWFEEIDETIRWFKEVKTFLNKHGYKTKVQIK